MGWFVLIGVLIVIVYIIIQDINENNRRYVEENSDILKSLKDLNTRYRFNEIDNSIKYYEYHTYKAKFDRDTTAKFMNRHILITLIIILIC